jgi:ferrochelatase
VEARKTALVLLNMGGPDSIEAVEPFLYNLFSDRDLIQLPLGALLQKPFARLISHFRAKTVTENYRRIGGKSPLLYWTALQAEKCAAQLGDNWHPYAAMRYWAPRADETLARMRQDGIEQAVVLSMYPHYTRATAGSSVKDFQHTQAQVYPELECTYIESWHDWPPYLDALAECVDEGLARFSEAQPDAPPPTLLFSAHALPQKFIERGDPYQKHVEDTVAGVMQRVGDMPWEIGYQSRSGPVKWMSPDTLDVIAKAGEEKRALLVVPVSFVSDHIETLEEVDVEFREHAQEHGVPWFDRVPALNARESFIKALEQLVRECGGM